ncbi:MAG: peptidylprolyl isomerase [Cypionkella sp.]
MMNPRAVFQMVALASAVVISFAVTAPAGPFSAIKVVNDRTITQFEYDQRWLFMKLLRQPGNLEELAMQTLIEDRLRMSAADQFGIKLTPEQIKAGMEEFAARANLDLDKFIEIIGAAGVQPESFRDFVEAGLVWREVVRGKYAGSVSISDAAVDRAMASFTPVPSLMFRLSVIELPATGAGRDAALKLAQHLRLELKAGGDFAALARTNSKAASAGRGGALDWLKLSDLPKEAALAVRQLQAGSVSDIVILDDKVQIYRVEEQKQEVVTPKTSVVDYAELLIPDDAKSIANVRANVDTCNDLYGMAKGLPADRLTRQTVQLNQLSKPIAGALSLLDPGEASTSMTRSGYRVYLMLCRRGPAETELPSRDEIKLQLTNQKLGTLAQIYLEELRSEAIIRTP